MDINAYESKLVVNAILRTDTFPKIYLTESTFFFDYDDFRNQFHFIRNAKVLLISGGMVFTLKEDSGYVKYDKIRYEGPLDSLGYADSVLVFFYTDTLYPKSGNSYLLEITEGFRKVTSSLTIPFPVIIDSTRIFYPEKPKDIYGEGQIIPYVKTYFNEIGEKTDYYRLTLDGWYKIYNFASDSTVVRYKKSYNVYPSATLGDPVKVLSGDLECFLFSSVEDKTVYHVSVKVEHLSYETGKYLESLQLSQENFDSPFTEPVMIKSNVEGGIGIFGAVAVSKLKVFQYNCK